MSTCGGPSCQVHITDTRFVPLLNSTRIHVSVFHTCIDQPVPGVAETSVALDGPRSNTARPPSVSYDLTRPDADEEAVGEGLEVRLGVGAGAGVRVDGPVDGDGRCVGEGRAFEPWAVASAAVTGRARGGSYAVPAITVCTPHHDSVTAAPVASSHASTCTSPLRIAGHTASGPTRVVHRAAVVHRSGPGPAAWRTVRRMASVLVVEDDQFVRSALIRHLTDAAHTVRSVGTALEALREVAHFRFDVVILDLGLPDLDGSEALKMLRGITDVPVIIATARDDETEIVRLLNAGADDYLTKPFSVEHLSARMAAVLRRARSGGAEAAPSAVLRVGGLTVDPLRRQAELDGVRLDLTRREFDLLAFLAGRPGVVVPRRELLAEVWQQSYGDDQTIDVHLSWLRRKLGETAARPRYLHTLRGVGVKLEPPVEPSADGEPVR
ncbi:DNA-binding response OmpR family regulator [Streptomyces puniciscabiei]|uniref:DNA-binding response OmpR family regulator n=2 Tax=Streptomyces puniciscabiei TaxID=164348 RepID=A0A542UIE4_9ACTN|nr:DNA-binding response OmpR family regulator [Streptomyces puniciscabiei]